MMVVNEPSYSSQPIVVRVSSGVATNNSSNNMNLPKKKKKSALDIFNESVTDWVHEATLHDYNKKAIVIDDIQKYRKFNSYYNTHQHCSILQVNQIPEGCSCRYLPLTKIRGCDTYEDYSFSLISVTNHTRAIQAFDFYNLRNYNKYHVNMKDIKKAEEELRKDANTHFHTRIVTILIFIITAVAF
ncbi:unnamed protein product [Adineta steineri]|uniref:Uncharacterized protein n=1 Tax=Adineta steineri TaxID=433720 RepID=A0A819G5X8_9BILA|nr:unnamed protein product [Adineta steineri]